MGAPGLVKNLLYNVALNRLGRREQTAYYPVAACYLVTYRCELECCYCLENTRFRCPDGQISELDTEGALATVAGIRTCCGVIDISGGEPALRADLDLILQSCRELRFEEIMLNSNGLSLLDRLGLLTHVHTVVLGIDSLHEDGFVRITGGTSAQHRLQLEALETLCRLRSELHFDLELCTVMLAEHLDEIEPIIDWCFRHEVLLSLSPHIGPDLRVDARLADDPRYRQITSKLVDYRRQGLPLLGSFGYYEGLRDLGRHNCLPIANLTVNPLGEMFWPCGEIQQRGPSFVEGKPYRQMVDEARASLGPLPDCTDRCHFSCRLALSAVINRPWDLPAERKHLKRYRRFASSMLIERG